MSFDPKIESYRISNLPGVDVIFGNFNTKCVYRDIIFLINIKATGVTKKT